MKKIILSIISFVFILGIGSHLPAQAEENETKKRK